jgi:hypothetical protein
MSHADYFDDKFIMVHTVNDSIISHSGPICLFRTGQLSDSIWKWILAKAFDHSKNTRSYIFRQSL